MSLVEVVVALLILAVGWGGLVALHQLAVHSLVDTQVAEEARWTLQAVGDSVESGAGPSSGRSDRAWGWIEWQPADGGVLVRAQSLVDTTLAVLWVGSGGRP